MTADELHSYLCRSTLPTLLVEGKGDRGILRKFGDLLVTKNIDVLPVGGKLVLDAVYERRAALTGAQVVFMRDRDEFCVLEEPDDFNDYVLTSGYSIENDVLDRGIIDRLAGETSGALASLVTEFATWFRARLQNYVMKDPSLPLATDVTAILRDGGFTEDAGREVAETDLVTPFDTLDVTADAWRWVRGKSLLRAVYSHFEGISPRYSMDQICDLCIRMGPSPSLANLAQRVLGRF
ncbi:MAG: hypothetical protein KA144_03905 [Xanthomonadaceae bacterium]|nr:hypothetical protein [Xanthomonadaceae bacterium]